MALFLLDTYYVDYLLIACWLYALVVRRDLIV